MRKKVYKIIAVFIGTIFTSLILNIGTGNKDAEAAMICEWHGDWTRVCCFSDEENGCPLLDNYEWDGPYYHFES